MDGFPVSTFIGFFDNFSPYVFQVLNVPAIIANKSVDVSLPLISKKESVMKMDPLTNLQVI